MREGEQWVPEDPGPSLPPPPSTGEGKRFSRKTSNFLSVDSPRRPPCWPQSGCVPSRQLLAQVFKQCRRSLVALGATDYKSCHLEEGLPDERGMSQYPQLWVLRARGASCVQGAATLRMQQREQSPGSSPLGQEDGLNGPPRHFPPGHHPLPPALSLFQELRVGSCLSKAWGHTPAAEMHLLVRLVTHSWPGGGTSGEPGRSLLPAGNPGQP